jgi:hypothetical protein
MLLDSSLRDSHLLRDLTPRAILEVLQLERAAALFGQRTERSPQTLELLSRGGLSLGPWLLTDDAQSIDLTEPFHRDDPRAASVFKKDVAHSGEEVRATVADACEVGCPQARVTLLD